MTRESMAVRISNNNNAQVTQGEVTLVTCNQKERTRRALKWWAGLWGGGCVCVIFPLVHFILVPSLLLAGPIVSWIMYNQISWIEGGRGTCPLCQAELKIARSSPTWPIKDICEKCLNHVEVNPAT